MLFRYRERDRGGRGEMVARLWVRLRGGAGKEGEREQENERGELAETWEMQSVGQLKGQTCTAIRGRGARRGRWEGGGWGEGVHRWGQAREEGTGRAMW